MLFSNDRDELRTYYFKTWHRYKNNQPLEPLEQQIITVLLEHPEYLPIIEDQKAYLSHDFREINPFLHFALHIALHDQIQLNQPEGITAIYQEKLTQTGSAHLAEHAMMEILAHTIFDMVHQKNEFDAVSYLDKLRNAKV